MANLGLGWLPPVPPPPLREMERIYKRLHISTYLRRAAEEELAAFLEGEDYTFTMPEQDHDGFVVPVLNVPDAP